MGERRADHPAQPAALPVRRRRPGRPLGELPATALSVVADPGEFRSAVAAGASVRDPGRRPMARPGGAALCVGLWPRPEADRLPLARPGRRLRPQSAPGAGEYRRRDRLGAATDKRAQDALRPDPQGRGPDRDAPAVPGAGSPGARRLGRVAGLRRDGAPVGARGHVGGQPGPAGLRLRPVHRLASRRRRSAASVGHTGGRDLPGA